MKQAAAEFLGTFILIMFGVGVVAQTVLSKDTAGSVLAINIGWGLGVMLGVYCALGVSGAHLNPAVSVAMAATGRFPWASVPLYAAAQMAGAFAAAVVVFLTYREAFTAFDGGVRQVEGALATAGVFATYPKPFLSILGGFVDQFVGTALLLIGVLAITDQKNSGAPAGLVPVIVGLLVVAIGVAFGFNSGYAINPARDFGPRLFTAIAGWGGGVFTAGNGWWWIPIVAPCFGGIAGALAYDTLVGKHLPATRSAS